VSSVIPVPVVRFLKLSVLATILSALLLSPVWAERPKVGLVLGGGGARGAAHIGVLKIIERERIPIDYIAGTSMGAIVGALYATGKSPVEIEEIINSIDWLDALTDKGPRSEHSIRSKKSDIEFAISMEVGFNDGKFQFPNGLLQGQRLEILLRRLLIDSSQIEHFDALPIPFRAVATNLATMQPVVFDRGDLARAVRASMSVPGAFEPVRFEDMVLVDGGIVDNVPVDVARAMGADVLIVVDVRTPLVSASELKSVGAILNQVINGLMTAETDEEIETLTPNDTYILPNLGSLSSADFSNAGSAILQGEEAAAGHLEQLRRLSLSNEEYASHVAARPARIVVPPTIHEIDVQHAASGTRESLEKMLAWQKGQPLDLDMLENSISSAYSEGTFSTIQYKVENDANLTNLSIQPIDKPWGPTIVEAALRVSDDFEGNNSYQVSVETLTSDVNRSGAKWINRVRLGLRTGLFSEFYQPISDDRSFFIAPSFEYAGRNVSVRTDFDQTIWRDQRTILALDAGRALGNHAELRIGYEFGYADTKLQLGGFVIDGDHNSTISQLTLEYLRDTLDDSAFPQGGLFLDVKINRPLTSFGADATATAYLFDVYKPVTFGASTLLFGLTANTLSNDDVVPFQETFSLGGITRLSGYQPDELFGRHAGIASVVYYRRIGHDSSSMFGTPLYIGASIETGAVWFDRDDISFESLQLAGSIFAGFDTPVGPIYFGYGRAEHGAETFHLTFGSLVRRLPTR